MVDIGPVGAIVAAIWLAQTIISAIFAARSKRGEAAWRWRRRMEPVHLDLLDWAWSVQMWAAARGLRDQMPPLPESLRDYHPEEGDDHSAEEWGQLRWRRDRAP